MLKLMKVRSVASRFDFEEIGAYGLFFVNIEASVGDRDKGALQV